MNENPYKSPETHGITRRPLRKGPRVLRRLLLIVGWLLILLMLLALCAVALILARLGLS